MLFFDINSRCTYMLIGPSVFTRPLGRSERSSSHHHHPMILLFLFLKPVGHDVIELITPLTGTTTTITVVSWHRSCSFVRERGKVTTSSWLDDEPPESFVVVGVFFPLFFFSLNVAGSNNNVPLQLSGMFLTMVWITLASWEREFVFFLSFVFFLYPLYGNDDWCPVEMTSSAKGNLEIPDLLAKACHEFDPNLFRHAHPSRPCVLELTARRHYFLSIRRRFRAD